MGFLLFKLVGALVPDHIKLGFHRASARRRRPHRWLRAATWFALFVFSAADDDRYAHWGLLFAIVFGLARPHRIRKFRDRITLWRARRAFELACAAIGREPLASRPPDIVHVGRTHIGVTYEVMLRPGTAIVDLEIAAPHLASYYRCREVRITNNPHDAGRAWITIVTTDALAEDLPRWPLARVNFASLSYPIPIGVDENFRPVDVELPGHHLLIGGEPGAGKSVALSQIVAAAALDPNVRLHLLDGKLVELAPFQPCATHFVGPSLPEAITLLAELRAAMDERYARLVAEGRRKVEPHDPEGLDVVVCDELALYLTHPDKKRAAEFAAGFRDLVARGRAAGVIVIAATQKPSVDVVPSSIRDLFGYRWAMRCSTKEASDTILGSGWSTLGFSSADLDASTRGIGLLLHEGGEPVRVRAFHLDDDAVAAIVGRAVRTRFVKAKEEAA